MKTFKHGGGPGDAIYGLAIMKELGGGILHLNFDGHKKFDQRLFERQDYIKKIVHHVVRPMQKWFEMKVDYDLDKFRQQPYQQFTLLECHAMAMNIKMDFTKPWLSNIEPKYVAPIVITDTGRLRWPGNTVDWDQLRGFEKDCIFIGFKGEHDTFVKTRKLNIDFYKIKDAYEWAQIMLGGKLFIGNQSSGLSIAEGLKVPRVADIWEGKSKQYPFGKHGYYELSADLIRRYLNG